jgi:hypothetical protein
MSATRMLAPRRVSPALHEPLAHVHRVPVTRTSAGGIYPLPDLITIVGRRSDGPRGLILLRRGVLLKTPSVS